MAKEGKILWMDDWRPNPSIMIRCGKQVHVYPVSYFVDYINGMSVEPLPDDVQRTIVSEWLNTVVFAAEEEV